MGQVSNNVYENVQAKGAIFNQVSKYYPKVMC